MFQTCLTYFVLLNTEEEHWGPKNIKGIAHTKMNILSLITNRRVFPNP